MIDILSLLIGAAAGSITTIAGIALWGRRAVKQYEADRSDPNV